MTMVMTDVDLAREAADEIRPLLDLAGQARGTQPPDSPARAASDRVNEVLRGYLDANGNVTELARHLEPDISLAGLRRRVRVARSGVQLGVRPEVRRGSNGNRDPEVVDDWAQIITRARYEGTDAYRQAVQEAYQANVSLHAVAEKSGISYYSLWAVLRS